ncbi:MAG: 2-amino-4-hydroxy-6-hydroxymethyldihydropteridine diphosphokinase [Alphaproteobacteria bacterium]|nr:2-amino-4-hydroxy-6-hydroxymethyldihydropteridine diphosphokinase [Alphaproteobacteria bacterium]
MILVALGANLADPRYGSPREACETALDRLAVAAPVRVRARSPWYESAPQPPADQPRYVNGVALVTTELGPEALLDALLSVEASMGRRRRAVNEARVIDLDLIDFNGLIRDPPAVPILPHPRVRERAFVLQPILDLALDWRHPVDGRGAAELLAAMPPDPSLRRLPDPS